MARTEQKRKDLKLMDKLTSQSRLTEDDVTQLAERIDRAVTKKLAIWYSR